ncbi:substrate-binding domain-containing protein [Dendronalium sp. ChiSLP03b]|uniref:substrate-binding domain-containing protein n=1 Tax=Dendronalium sp. ChiSLP03b TaxID=3075381 RepID=UPI002AD3B7FA|nr:substrate-binding domain-containing protein [Dendronalium sp. ChiSLP03b]MDZ8209499.1 substrate-binding domain-containing protein [Dendronalium sp. ChiSLP03b]
MKKYLLVASLTACIFHIPLAKQTLAATFKEISPTKPDKVTLFGAGSLRGALSEVAKNFENVAGVTVETSFAFSGLQRERIENGQKADVFASADISNPLTLYQKGLSGPVINFTNNRLVAVTNSDSQLTTDNFLQQFLSNVDKIGTFPPLSDPLGAYTQDVYRKADAILPGSLQNLNEKSIFFTQELVPPDKFTSGGLIAWGLQEAPLELKVDAFISYYTSALAALEISPNLKVVELPENLAIKADYGLTVLKDAGPKGQELADYILSSDGQKVLVKYGFSPLGVTPKPVPEPSSVGGVFLAVGIAFALNKKQASAKKQLVNPFGEFKIQNSKFKIISLHG